MFMMCGKSTPYLHKFVGGCVIIMIIVTISMSVFIRYSGGSEAKVELNGDQDQGGINSAVIWAALT